MDFSSFKKITFEAARLSGGAVIETFEPTVTPNFFAAQISLNKDVIYMLSTYEGVWGFSKTFEPMGCDLKFVDSHQLSTALQDNFGINPLSSEVLYGEFNKQPSMLEADIRYWKPKTLGEGIFNWWD